MRMCMLSNGGWQQEVKMVGDAPYQAMTSAIVLESISVITSLFVF